MSRISVLFFSLLPLLFSMSLHGQVRVEGTVSSLTEKGTETVPFANVVLLNADDSTKVDFTSVTDMQGKFVFESVPMHPFLLEISCVGYVTYREAIEITFPEVGNKLRINRSLQPDVKQLGEVTIIAQTVQQGLDKTTYLITSSDLKSARFSMDLLEKIPEITLDPVSQKLKSAKGSLKILIDGVAASEIDLKAIPPNRVLRIENYDMPPARYMIYGSVVNVVTKNIDEGFAAGATLQHAFTTGFFNDDVFFVYNSGRSRLSADYTVNHRNYTKVKTEERYDYTLYNQVIQREKFSKNPFGYDDHFINLKYTLQEKDKYAFQAKFSPTLQTAENENESEITIQQSNNLSIRTGTSRETRRSFNSKLNLYYWKQLANKQSITVDAVGNLFDSRQNIFQQEYNTENHQLDLDDRMNLKNLKKSFIGELFYEKNFTTDRLSIGNKTEAYSLRSEVVNSFNNTDYISSFVSNYLYSDYTGAYGAFQYRLLVGLTYKNMKNAKTAYDAWIFTPQILLGYKINVRNMIRVAYGEASQEPDISQQSDNIVFVTDNILKTGNPYLKNSKGRQVLLMYDFNNKYLNIRLINVYGEASNNIASYYIHSEDDNYLFTFINEEYTRNYASNWVGTVKPLGNDKLSLKLSVAVAKFATKNDITGYFAHWYKPINFTLQWKPNDNWQVSYQGTTESYRLNGSYLIKDENNNHFTLRFKKDKFSVWGSLLFMFAPSRYVSKTIPESLVQYLSDRKIYDNRNMFTLGLSYTFNSGKKYEEQQKRIDNKDSDAGFFK